MEEWAGGFVRNQSVSIYIYISNLFISYLW